MAAQRRNIPEQEHSIKERSQELFIEETPVVAPRATKPFGVFLRETPAQPLSPGIQALLWAVGGVVAVLFLVALWRVAHHHSRKAPPTEEAPAATVMVRDLRPSRGDDLPRT
jgi:hypothetical protein